MTRRNYTAELLQAQRDGKVIVNSCAPYEGWAMTYDPRTKNDPKPWRITDLFGDAYHYNGRFCHAIDQS